MYHTQHVMRLTALDIISAAGFMLKKHGNASFMDVKNAALKIFNGKNSPLCVFYWVGFVCVCVCVCVTERY